MKTISIFHAAVLLEKVARGYVLDRPLGKLGNRQFSPAEGGSPPGRCAGFFENALVGWLAFKKVLFSTGARRQEMRSAAAAIYGGKLCRNLFGKLTGDMGSKDDVLRARRALDRMRSWTSNAGRRKVWVQCCDGALSQASAQDRKAVLAGIANLRKQLGVMNGYQSARHQLNDIERLVLARQHASAHGQTQADESIRSIGAEPPKGKKSVRFADEVRIRIIPARSQEMHEGAGRTVFRQHSR